MKKTLTFLALVAATLGLAQQETHSSQFMINPQIMNPAYSSMDNNLNVFVGYRNQWGGIDGAPNTTYASVFSPVGKPRWSRTHPGDFHNWHGTGVLLLSDQIGPYQTTRLNGNYSYNIGLIQGADYGYEHKDGLRLALGTSFGLSTYRLNKDILSQTKNLSYENSNHDPTINDPTFQELGEARQNALDVSFGGILYYDNKYFLGLSTTQLLQNTVSQIDEISLARHYFITGTYKLQINEEYYLIPSVITKFVKGAPVSANFTTRLDWQDKWYLGVGYRTDDAFTFLVGSHIKWGEKVKNFRVDKHRYMLDIYYSYDWTASRLGSRELSRNSKGSHEVTIAFFLPPMFKERNAEDTWRNDKRY